MAFLKILVEYWAQATVLILAIGYVLRVVLEFYIKRKEIKFNFIHKERAEVIKQLHLDIIEMSKEIELMALAHTLKSLNPHTLKSLNQGPTNKEREEVFHKIATLNRSIYDNIDRNRIYFSESFVSQFETLVKKVRDNFIITSLDKNVLIRDQTKDYIFNDSESFLKYHEEEFPILKQRLQKEFKRYL